MTKAKKNSTDYLLEKTKLLLSQVGKAQKQLIPCKTCGERKGNLYHGICLECRTAVKIERDAKRVGFQWFRPDGYAVVYNEQLEPVLYSRYRMEQILGRKLGSNESVTYKDQDRGNIVDSNLVLVTKGGLAITELICSHCKELLIKPSED